MSVLTPVRHDPNSRHNDVIEHAGAVLRRLVALAAISDATTRQVRSRDFIDFKHIVGQCLMQVSVELADVPPKFKIPIFDDLILTIGTPDRPPSRKEIYLLSCLIGGSVSEAELFSPVGRRINCFAVQCARGDDIPNALRLLKFAARGSASVASVTQYLTDCMTSLLAARDVQALTEVTLASALPNAPVKLRIAVEAARYSPPVRDAVVAMLENHAELDLTPHDIWLLGTMFLHPSVYAIRETATRLSRLGSEPKQISIGDSIADISKILTFQFVVSCLPWSLEEQAHNESRVATLAVQALDIWFKKRPLRASEWMAFAHATSDFVCVLSCLVQLHPPLLNSAPFQSNLKNFLRAAPSNRRLHAPTIDNIAALCRSAETTTQLYHRVRLELEMIISQPETESDDGPAAEAQSDSVSLLSKLTDGEKHEEVQKVIAFMAIHLPPDDRIRVLGEIFNEEELVGIVSFLKTAEDFYQQSVPLFRTIISALQATTEKGNIGVIREAARKLTYAAELRASIWDKMRIEKFTESLRNVSTFDAHSRYLTATALMYDTHFSPVRFLERKTLVALARETVGPRIEPSREPNRFVETYFTAKRSLLIGNLDNGLSDLCEIIFAEEAPLNLKRTCLERGIELLCFMGAHREAAAFLSKATRENATYSKKELATVATPRRAIDWMLVGYAQIGFSISVSPPEYSRDVARAVIDSHVRAALAVTEVEVEELTAKQRLQLVKDRPLFELEFLVLQTIANRPVRWTEAVERISAVALKLDTTDNQIPAAALILDSADYLIAGGNPADMEGAHLLVTFAHSRIILRAAAEAEHGGVLDWQVLTLQMHAAEAAIGALAVIGDSRNTSTAWVEIYRQAAARLASEHGETELVELITLREEFAPDLRAWEVI